MEPLPTVGSAATLAADLHRSSSLNVHDDRMYTVAQQNMSFKVDVSLPVRARVFRRFSELFFSVDVFRHGIRILDVDSSASLAFL